MWKPAIEDALAKARLNIDRFGELFPHVSERGVYSLNPNTDWTDGFWAGILWLGFQYSGDETFRTAARRTVDSFRARLERNVALEHHDIGFLYDFSARAQWIIEGDPEAKRLTLQAANLLLSRWREPLRLLQAWGLKDDPVNGGRIIIDCLMNLPLLYWASETTGDPQYRMIAERQAELSRKYLVRGDDSSYHTFYFDMETGEPLRGGTHQGYRDGSTWTRGQAWGIYGFALSFRYTRNPLFLEASRRLARYFVDHLPADAVAYWDFDAPVTEDPKRDSSASAIAAAGMLELIGLLGADHPETPFLLDAVERSMKSLVENYSTIGEPLAQGLIKHGAYHVRAGAAPDDFMIWGDYYYLETLLRLEKGTSGFWYE